MAEELVRDGRVVRITTSGWRTGRPREVVAGYVDEPDGSLLVAAGDDDASWGQNLLAEPECVVESGERRFRAVAEPLSDDEHARAVRELILRYGTPSERLGRGPSFRLRPVDEERSA